ncbi:penicillin-binding protein 2 [bacterium]|nr:penicillin-binding protein 2 [bacterium]
MTKRLSPRFFIILLTCYLVVGLFAVRLFYLQVLRHDFFVQKSERQVQKIIKIQSHRGVIYDRNKRPLALSKKAYSIYAVPPKIEDAKQFAKAVSSVLKLPKGKMFKSINTSYPFVWLRRKVDREMMEAVTELELEGLHVINEEKRVYPKVSLGGDVLGFVGMDGGLGGLEYQYDTFLKGSSAKIIVEGDPRGYPIISGSRDVQGTPTGFRLGIKRFEPMSFDGGHVYVTLDERIQYAAEKALREGVERMEAQSGVAIVMDPHSGEILAMADYPQFDPNRFYKAKDKVRKNSAVVDVFEPGSVFKVFLMASALEEGIVTPGTVIRVPEELQLFNRTISEAHRRKPGESDRKTATDILVESLNVGTTMIATQLGEAKYYKYLRGFGFGQRTGIALPGESQGLLRHPRDWSAVDIGMMSFGQGVAVTTLQLATAVSVVANGGMLVRPRIVQYLTDHESVTVKATPKTSVRRVISEKTARQVREMMGDVVTHGTGTPARIRGYSLGGKTGTAQKAAPGGLGYLKNDYVASFISVFPLHDPQVVIVVAIDTPRKSIWGSTVAAPVVRQIAKTIIETHNIPPDELRLP